MFITSIGKQQLLTDAEVLRALLEERVDDLLRLHLLDGQRRRGDLLADDLLLLDRLHGDAKQDNNKRLVAGLFWRSRFSMFWRCGRAGTEITCTGPHKTPNNNSSKPLTGLLHTGPKHPHTHTHFRSLQSQCVRRVARGWRDARTQAPHLPTSLREIAAHRRHNPEIRRRRLPPEAAGHRPLVYLLGNHRAAGDVRG